MAHPLNRTHSLPLCRRLSSQGEAAPPRGGRPRAGVNGRFGLADEGP